MKFLLCICLFVAIIGGVLGELKLSPEVKEMLEGVQASCEAEVGLDPSVVINAKKTMTIPNDEKFKCFLKCMMATMGVMSQDGNLMIESALENIPPEIIAMGAEKIMNVCKGEKGANPCDTAYKLVLCFAKEKKEIGEVFT